MIRKSEHQLTYPVALILSNAKRKTCEIISSEAGLSGDTFLRILNRKMVTIDDLVKLAQKALIGNKWYLIIDDTIIDKLYAKVIEGACDNYDSASKNIYRSLCSIAAVITDGKTVIPIEQMLWISKEFAPNNYKKKWELAHELIEKLKNVLPIYMLIADGLYATENMIKKCLDKNIFFEMRFHSNRIVEWNGNKAQIKKWTDLELKGRRCKRSRCAYWRGMKLYFTAFKRVAKTGRVTIVYQVSNYKASAREHVQNYGYRWGIEMFFRTAKQHLGLNHCQVQNQSAQENHIRNVFFAYALLQIEKKKHRLKNTEDALRRLKRKKYENLLEYLA